MSDDDDDDKNYEPTIEEIRQGNSSDENEEECTCGDILYPCAVHKRRSRASSRVWKYFDRRRNGKLGICRLCGKTLSCATTITNLKSHIKSSHSHQEAYVELFGADVQDDTGTRYLVEPAKVGSITSGKYSNQISGILSKWFNTEKNCPRCRLCLRYFPRTAQDLDFRSHLRHRHLTDYDKLQQLEESVADQSNLYHVEIVGDTEIIVDEDVKKINASDVPCTCGADDGDEVGKAIHESGCARAPLMSSWDYFDNITVEKANCRLCQESVSWGTSVDDLRAHLTENHPEVAVSLNDTEVTISQPKDSTQDAIQIEYLDENHEEAEDVDITEKSNGRKYAPKFNSRKRRRESREKSFWQDTTRFGREEDDAEWGKSLDRFGLYVGSLMRLLPKSTALKYQTQIVDKLVRESLKTDDD